MAASIILIGPIGAGKTTQMKLLGTRLGWPAFDLDDLRWEYYKEIGYDEAYANGLRDSGDWFALERYWKPFEAHSVERVLADYPVNHVIAFGGGQSVYDDPQLFARVERALAPFPVILLMPTPDIEQSTLIGRQRIAALVPELPESALDMITSLNRALLTSPSNARLAKHTLYTQGQSPEQTCDAIVALLRDSLDAK